jgi:carbon storage regulator
MLVLTRKRGEAVVLPDQDIVFTILEIQGNKVRVGIAAPTSIEIHRREVWLRMQGEVAEKPTAVAVAAQ